MKIQEVIVVEGKHDASKIKACVEADILISNGTHVSNSFLEQCKKLNSTRGIIVFTDPDGPGEWIRRKIIDYVGDCEHASLDVQQVKNKGKVGIEHATCDMIQTALKKRSTFVQDRQSIEPDEFRELGLSGQAFSQEKRDLVASGFSFPKSNAKSTLKYLNMMGITYKEVLEYLEVNYGNNCK